MLRFKADACLFVQRNDLNATILVCTKDLFCPFTSVTDLDSTTAQLTRLKSTRLYLYRVREREKEAREHRLGEQSAFCVHPHVHRSRLEKLEKLKSLERNQPNLVINSRRF